MRLIIDTVQPWIFHDEFLPRNIFSHIKVLMDNGFDLIIFMVNSAKSFQSIHEMFLGNKESLIGVYYGSNLVCINECGFGSHEVQS